LGIPFAIGSNVCITGYSEKRFVGNHLSGKPTIRPIDSLFIDFERERLILAGIENRQTCE
jgi:hypothetical protein